MLLGRRWLEESHAQLENGNLIWLDDYENENQRPSYKLSTNDQEWKLRNFPDADEHSLLSEISVDDLIRQMSESEEDPDQKNVPAITILSQLEIHKEHPSDCQDKSDTTERCLLNSIRLSAHPVPPGGREGFHLDRHRTVGLTTIMAIQLSFEMIIGDSGTLTEIVIIKSVQSKISLREPNVGLPVFFHTLVKTEIQAGILSIFLVGVEIYLTVSTLIMLVSLKRQRCIGRSIDNMIIS
jgi:hypothetical protein